MAGPSVTTIKRLFALSGNQCAFPGCREPLVNGDVLVGEVCHIKGSKPGAPRYDASQSEFDRNGFDNLILLCANHHKVVDTDLKSYTVKELRDTKYLHETRRTDAFAINDGLAERIALAMGGTAAGMLLDRLLELAIVAKDFLPIGDREPSLHEIECSTIYYHAGSQEASSEAELISRVYGEAGWRIEPMGPEYLNQIPAQAREGLFLIVGLKRPDEGAATFAPIKKMFPGKALFTYVLSRNYVPDMGVLVGAHFYRRRIK